MNVSFPSKVFSFVFAKCALLLFVCAPFFQAAGNTGLTAEELILKARAAAVRGEWKDSATLYAEFFDGYGTAKEIAPLLPGLRHEYATALIHTKNFSAALPLVERCLEEKNIPPSRLAELKFWKAFCQVREGQFGKSRSSFESFMDLFPDPKTKNPLWMKQNPMASKVPDATLMVGASFLMEGKNAEGFAYLENKKAQLHETKAAQATLLQLQSLAETGKTDSLRTALPLLSSAHAENASQPQVAALHLLSLRIGNLFYENELYREALLCFQKVWTRERIVKHQQSRLESLEERLEKLNALPNSDLFEKIEIRQTSEKIRKEIASLDAMPDFDPSLRLRVASAFQSMGRYREAALVLQEITDRFPEETWSENALLSLARNWHAAGRWEDCIHAASRFETLFPHSEKKSSALYLAGIAEQKSLRYEKAIAAFKKISSEYPKSELSPRASFMEAFTLLLAEKSGEATPLFDGFLKKYPKHDLAENALYWKAMSLSLSDKMAPAREAFSEFLKKYPSGELSGNAKFRMAYCAQSAMDFPVAIRELEAFLQNHPGHENEGEALLLLGDALMNEGEMEKGIDAFARIPPENTRFFEEGWFKTGTALKKMEEFARFREKMLLFCESYPNSPRVAEALFHAGWVLRKEGDTDSARRVYWDAITAHGNNPEAAAIEDLLSTLPRLYPGETETKNLLQKLRISRIETKKEHSVLRVRLLWAEANAQKKRDPESSLLLLLQAAREATPQTTNPRLLADFANARKEIGDSSGAETLFRELLKWHPRSPQKDQAYAFLGEAELGRSKPENAQNFFLRFEKECPGSPLAGKVLLAKSKIEQRWKHPEDAKNTLNKLLSESAIQARDKAEALFRLGEIFMEEGKPHLAIPYFQRIYVVHGKHLPFVAESYLLSAEAFAATRETEASQKTYAELMARPELVKLLGEDRIFQSMKKSNISLPSSNG